MWHPLNRIYNLLFSPRQKDEDFRNREIVLNVLLVGTLLILGLAILVIIGNYISGRTFVVPRAVGLSIVSAFVVYIFGLSRRGHYTLAAWLLVGVYFLLAAAVGLAWSIALPSAVLLYGLVVVMAGILLGPRYSLIGFGLVVLLIIGTVLAESNGLIMYDLKWRQTGPGPDDIFGLSFMLGMIAAVSWLFNYQMARSLKRAQRAEAALVKQKDLLEVTVEERTNELQAAQLEKIQQMYRFAELGQLSTALMHDLANHMTSLTLNIESLEGQTRSKVLTQAKQTIRYIDEMVIRVRDQLQGRANIRPFNVAQEIDEMVKMLRSRAQTADVTLVWHPPADKKDIRTRGEAVKFRQMIANLISNAVDAYLPRKSPDEKREVLVTVIEEESKLVITVTDFGRGIPLKDRPKLFEPFHSTKKTGMGMGLFIVKQIAQEHFLGSVDTNLAQGRTSFIVTLPKATL
jgi:signal transduction histidine kinase